jgi:hypothetical protein
MPYGQVTSTHIGVLLHGKSKEKSSLPQLEKFKRIAIKRGILG